MSPEKLDLVIKEVVNNISTFEELLEDFQLITPFIINT